MQTSFPPSQKHRLKTLLARLNFYGFPGLWWLRWQFFKIALWLLDRQFVKSDVDQAQIFQIDIEQASFQIRRGTSDKFVIDETWRKKEYGGTHKGTVVDLGANIGAFTIYAAQNAERVIAVEASSENLQLLEKNVKLNKLDNVFIENACISSRYGTSTLYFHTINNGMSSTLYKGPSKHSESVRNITFRELFEKYSICLLYTSDAADE